MRRRNSDQKEGTAEREREKIMGEKMKGRREEEEE